MTERHDLNSFWMVARKPTGPHSRTEPRQRYGTFADAQDAARKLSNQSGDAYVVLAPVAIIRPHDDLQGALL